MYISNNKKYIILENIVLDTHTGLKFCVDNIHPVVVCNIFKEQTLYSYKHNLEESTSLFSKIKKLVYPLLKTNNDILCEYEVRYGMKLITENKYSYGTELLIAESWDFLIKKFSEKLPINFDKLINEQNWLSNQFDKAKNIGGKVIQSVKDAGGKVIQSVKDAAGFVLNKGLPWFFQKLESFLLNPVTIGADVALSALGIGKVAGAVLWGSLGIWKIYQLSIGKLENNWFTYLDIGLCLLGLVLTGAVVKPIKSVIKTVRNPAKLVKLPVFKPFLKLLSMGSGAIKNYILQPIKWLSDTLGSKHISGMIQAAQNKLDDVIKYLQSIFTTQNRLRQIKAATQSTKPNTLSNIRTTLTGAGAGTKISNAAYKGAAAGFGVAAATKGIEKGVNWYAEREARKQQEKMNQLGTALSNIDVKGEVDGDLDSLLANIKNV
jgi:hypothetical protein